MIKVIKRNGQEVEFNFEKIVNAILKANKEVKKEFPDKALDNVSLTLVHKDVYNRCISTINSLNVEEIQDIVEKALVKINAYEVAKAYILYRYKRSVIRKANTTDDTILSLIDLSNEDIKQENSNKNPIIISTQRDYIAGEVSKDVSDRLLLPDDVVQADKEGLIHFHDKDYFIQKAFNCSLINLEDMLQNGTVISGVKIDKPKSFITACTIVTQIIAQVASSQFGGQSITLSHLAPFVDVSRQKIRKQTIEDLKENNIILADEKINNIVERKLKREISSGIQTIQYQITTLMTTNGQAPFVTVFMYLGEVSDKQIKNDLALLIEETIKQRYIGVKNKKGVYISPAFPKLIYVLEKDNITEDSRYWYLTKLSAKCSAKRLVPDYISEKKMKLAKQDKCFPCMGCVDGQETVTYKLQGQLYVESLERAWHRLREHYLLSKQANNYDEYLDLKNEVEFYDTKKGFVKAKRIIRNHSKKWLDIKFSNGRRLQCTPSHEFTLIDNQNKYAKDLRIGDKIQANFSQYSSSKISFDTGKAWLLGLLLYGGNYSNSITISLKSEENDVIDKAVRLIKDKFHINPIVIGREGEESYKSILIYDKETENHSKRYLYTLQSYLLQKFGGIQRRYRHIPNEVFSWNRQSKLSFLAGIIDANGYSRKGMVQINCIKKELALQQMALAQSLNMPSHLYYDKSNDGEVTYIVEFYPTKELISYIVCEKKKLNYKDAKPITITNPVTVTKIHQFDEETYSYDVTTESEHFEVSGLYSHNCRSFLSVYEDGNGKSKFYGRFNKGVVTINLVDVACSSGKDINKFWKIFDERLELCHKALICRYERLKGTISDVAPILWQHGAIARLSKGETIDKLLTGGYSTISLGYAGLCECVYYMTGKSHTDKNVTPFALEIMKYMNKKCDEWNEELNLGYSIYGTPLESTTYKFARCLRKRFGIIKGVTDKNYITNSYHVHVTEKINAFDKLKFESQFQELSTGGMISYIEVPNLENNIESILSVLKYIYDNIIYAEINTKSDYCQVCGWSNEIQIVENENKKLIWRCPNCGNTDQSKMNVVRRTCGYLGTNFWNEGRTQEIKERYVHLGDNES